jgi:hypothetical protein
MTLIQQLGDLRKKFAFRDITFWEISPALFAIIAPNMLQPEWLWRLIAFFVAGLSLLAVTLHALIAPEQIRFRNISDGLTTKYLVFLLYAVGIFLVPCILGFIMFPSVIDIFRVAQNPENPFEHKSINVIEWSGGGSVAPYFILQRLRTPDQTYYLPFSFRIWSYGTYEILYSSRTKIIYQVILP